MTHSIIFMFCQTAVTVGHVLQDSVALFSLSLQTEKLQQPSYRVSVHVFYNCSITAANVSVYTDFRFKQYTASEEVFSPGLAFKQNFEGIPKESLYKLSRTVKTFSPKHSPQTFAILVLPSSCRGVSRQQWQLHRIMTHANCACQMSLD